MSSLQQTLDDAKAFAVMHLVELNRDYVTFRKTGILPGEKGSPRPINTIFSMCKTVGIPIGQAQSLAISFLHDANAGEVLFLNGQSNDFKHEGKHYQFKAEKEGAGFFIQMKVGDSGWGPADGGISFKSATQGIMAHQFALFRPSEKNPFLDDAPTGGRDIEQPDEMATARPAP